MFAINTFTVQYECIIGRDIVDHKLICIGHFIKSQFISCIFSAISFIIYVETVRSQKEPWATLLQPVLGSAQPGQSLGTKLAK